jgi:endonuclease G
MEFFKFKKQIIFLLSSITCIFILCATSVTNEHLKYGIPGTCSTCQTLFREGYVACNDTSKKVPLWVAYHLTKEYLSAGTEKRANYKFLPDPDLAPDERAENKDYSKTGYDKGHMCPAADQSRNATTMKECFYLSNMCPQWPKLNRHPWEQLEAKIRSLAVKYSEIWVYVGPIFEKDTATKAFKPEKELGHDNIWVPWGFYKIVVFQDKGQLTALAFQYKNQDETNDIPAHEVTIDEVQQETDLDFLSNLPENEQKGIEETKPTTQELNKILD